MEPKMTINEVAGVIECEGLGYGVQYYTSGDSIADPVLAQMWDECADMMDAIEAYVERNYDHSLDEYEEENQDCDGDALGGPTD